MKPTYPLIALLILAFSASATKLPVLEPVASTVSDGGFVDLGTVGPGQTAEIIAESKITEGGTSGQGGIYDHLVFLNVPPGWKGTDSEKYGSPMKAIVVVAKDAPDGDYRLTMEAVDEPPGEGLGNIAFTAMVHVSKNVLTADVWPDKATTGAGHPAGYYVTIKNDGVASDEFKISS